MECKKTRKVNNRKDEMIIMILLINTDGFLFNKQIRLTQLSPFNHYKINQI
jgi:hypothetical protein